MAATTHALFDWEFSEVENKPDDAIVIDHKEFDLKKMKCEIEDLKERVHSEMKISLIIKCILVTVTIRVISFRLFYFS